MKKEIIKILNDSVGFVDRSKTSTCIWSDDFNDIAEQLTKIYITDIEKAYDKGYNDGTNKLKDELTPKEVETSSVINGNF